METCVYGQLAAKSCDVNFASLNDAGSTCFPALSRSAGTFFPPHIIAYGSPTHNLPSPPLAIFSASPGDDRRAPVSAAEAGGGRAARRGATAGPAPSHRVCLLKAGPPARRLTDSLRDSLDGSAHEMWLNAK